MIFLWWGRDPLSATEKPEKSPAATGRNGVEVAVVFGKSRPLFELEKSLF
jgi:hypothetical protein